MPEEEKLPADPDRYAVLIGINDYVPKPLKYSVNDVGLVRDGLISHCRFLPEQIFVIKSSVEEPEHDVPGRLTQVLSDLKSTVRPDATIFFYFSGHGDYLDKSYILFHQTEVAIQEIYEQIDALKPNQQCYVIDACHSGGDIDIKGRQVEMTEYYTQWLGARSSGVHFFCSSRANEKSLGLPQIQHGAYTYNFVKAMGLYALYDKEMKTLSLNELHTYAVKRILIDFDVRQTPFQFSKVSGYFPFCFYSSPRTLVSKTYEFPDTTERNIQAIIDDPGVNLPEEIKRDLINLLTELFLNLFDHNRSSRVDLKIEGNVIEVLDHSKTSFDPFTAVPVGDGSGIIVYQLFMERYKDLVRPVYQAGPPNIITFEFDRRVLNYRPVNPCHIQVGEVHLFSPRDLNGIDFDPDCPEIVMDISRTRTHLSFIVRHLFDFLLKHSRDTQMIVLKMHPDDMQRDFVKRMAGLEERFSRIMVI